MRHTQQSRSQSLYPFASGSSRGNLSSTDYVAGTALSLSEFGLYTEDLLRAVTPVGRSVCSFDTATASTFAANRLGLGRQSRCTSIRRVAPPNQSGDVATTGQSQSRPRGGARASGSVWTIGLCAKANVTEPSSVIWKLENPLIFCQIAVCNSGRLAASASRNRNYFPRSWRHLCRRSPTWRTAGATGGRPLPLAKEPR